MDEIEIGTDLKSASEATTQKNDAGKDDSKNAKTNESHAFERTLPAISIMFVLTYVSGYLVTSTFLNSYGIPADASEFLKARYLYVGFLYILFLAAIGIAFGCFAVIYNFASEKWIKKPVVDLGETPPDLKRRYRVVWTAAGLFFASSETLQIMFLSLPTIRSFILLQTGLLAAFLFYQLTNARAIQHPGWDRHRSIFYLRGFSITAITAFAILAVVFYFVPQLPGEWVPNFVSAHRGDTFALLNALLICSFIGAIPFFYTGKSLKRRLDGNEPKQNWFEGMGLKRALFGGLTLSLANLVLLVPYETRWKVLPLINTGMAAAGMASIIFISFALSRDRDKNNETLTNSEYWSVWLLRIATVGTLYVATAIGYANVFYPFMPFAKSGGDYMTAPVVRVRFQYEEILDTNAGASTVTRPLHSANPENNKRRKAGSMAIADDSSHPRNEVVLKTDSTAVVGLEPQETSCEPGISTVCTGLVILEESPDIVYFARLDDAVSLADGQEAQPGVHGRCGPNLWKNGIHDPKGPYRPRLIAVSRRNIVSIEEIEVVSETKECAN